MLVVCAPMMSWPPRSPHTGQLSSWTVTSRARAPLPPGARSRTLRVALARYTGTRSSLWQWGHWVTRSLPSCPHWPHRVWLSRGARTLGRMPAASSRG